MTNKKTVLVFLCLLYYGRVFPKIVFAEASVSGEYVAQSIDITGTVIDENGQPMIGVDVVEKGMENGTITDFSGNFSIGVSSRDAVLIFSFLGYDSQEMEVSTDGMSVIMEPSQQKLDEVVLIGYGEQSRTKTTGAVSKIESKSLERVASISLGQQMAGKMSGIVINQRNGTPGAGSQIIIRGTGTLTAGTQPLIVVDGFPLTEGSSLNSINPNDIVSIDVLKDAASAAIYGSRAANGVVLVTTKKGKSGDRFHISFDSYAGIQQQSSNVSFVDAYQQALFLKEARDWGYLSKDPANRSADDPNSVRVTKKNNGKNIDGRELYPDFLNGYLTGTPGLINTDWMKEGFRTAPIQNYTLSISGGGNNNSYYTSLGFFNQKGIAIGTDVKRYSGSVSLENSLNDKIKIGLNVKPSYTIKNSVDQSSRSNSVLGLMPLSFPYYSPYKDDGSLNISDQLVNEQRKIEGIKLNGTPVENLIATSSLVKNPTYEFRTFGNIFLDVKDIVKGLSYKLSLGADYDSYQKDYYYPIGVGSYRKPAPRSDADSSQKRKNSINYLIENLLTYKLETGKHTINAIAGHTFQKESNSSVKISGTGFSDDAIKNIEGASSYSASYSKGNWALESYLSRLQYDYDAKYLLSVAIRADGSSRFGINNRWGYFPSVSTGWVISSEDFFPENKILSYAKISASWGKTGNNQIGDYGSIALIGDNNYIFGNKVAPGYTSSTAANPNLGWEISSAKNIGMDLGLFENLLTLEVNYYNTQRTDLLLNVPIPQQTGYKSVLTNIGAMENKGFEYQLSGNNFSIGDFTLDFNANMTTYKNKVLALGPGQEKIATGKDQAFVTQIGHPISEIYGYITEGVYKTQKEIEDYTNSKGQHVVPLNGTLTGDYKIIDTNNDGEINALDKVSKGTYSPDLTYGFGGELGYKGFSFGFNFYGVKGRTIMDADMASLTESGEGFSVPSSYYFKNRYHPVDNPNGFLGQPNFGNFSNARKQVRTSTVVSGNNGNYIRLRDIKFSYDFNKKYLKNLHLTGVRLYVSANNLFTFTNFRSWNPDATTDSPLTAGYSRGNYPVARTFMMGLRIDY